LVRRGAETRGVSPGGGLGSRMDNLKRRLAQRESAAFAELYDLIADGLFHYLVTQTGTSEDAADLLQETFLRIHRASDRLGEVENLKAYCFRIAQHELLRWRKTHKARPPTGDLLYEIADPTDPHSLETQETVAQALSRLPPRDRQVVELKFFSGLTFVEIGQVLDKPQGTVATWYRRALRRLQTDLQPNSTTPVKQRDEP